MFVWFIISRHVFKQSEEHEMFEKKIVLLPKYFGLLSDIPINSFGFLYM